MSPEAEVTRQARQQREARRKRDILDALCDRIGATVDFRVIEDDLVPFVYALVEEAAPLFQTRAREAGYWRSIPTLIRQVGRTPPMTPPRSIHDRLVANAVDARGEHLLQAPCMFCDYNGASYWQSGSHKGDCPWFTVGGINDRIAGLENALRTALSAQEAREAWKSEDAVTSPLPLREAAERLLEDFDNGGWEIAEIIDHDLRPALAAPSGEPEPRLREAARRLKDAIAGGPELTSEAVAAEWVKGLKPRFDDLWAALADPALTKGQDNGSRTIP